jgi:hypothetical protein
MNNGTIRKSLASKHTLQVDMGAVVSILDSHRRDPGSIPCNVTFCPNLEIVDTWESTWHTGWTE